MIEFKNLRKKIEEFQKELAPLRNAQNANELDEMRRQLNVLAEEVERLRSDEEEIEVDDARRRALGLGPSAATIIQKRMAYPLLITVKCYTKTSMMKRTLMFPVVDRINSIS